MVRKKDSSIFKEGLGKVIPSPLFFFCLTEDVFSRAITNLVSNKVINLINGTRLVKVTSHTLYADDIMVFYKGDHKTLTSIMNLFKRYVVFSGQNINPSKSILYTGYVTHKRHVEIANKLGFYVVFLPIFYLVVPVFKGKT